MKSLIYDVLVRTFVFRFGVLQQVDNLLCDFRIGVVVEVVREREILQLNRADLRQHGGATRPTRVRMRLGRHVHFGPGQPLDKPSRRATTNNSK